MAGQPVMNICRKDLGVGKNGRTSRDKSRISFLRKSSMPFFPPQPDDGGQAPRSQAAEWMGFRKVPLSETLFSHSSLI